MASHEFLHSYNIRAWQSEVYYSVVCFNYVTTIEHCSSELPLKSRELITCCGYMLGLQWNLSDTDTLGTKIIVLISEVSLFQGKNNMWQSRIENKYYSLVYFERITEFDAL